MKRLYGGKLGLNFIIVVYGSSCGWVWCWESNKCIIDSLLNENDTGENESIAKLVDFGSNGVQMYSRAPNMVLHPKSMSLGLLLT